MTAAERKQRQREKLAGAGAKTFSIVISSKAAEILERYCEITGTSRLEHISSLAEHAITEWAILTEPSLPALAEWAAKRNKLTNGDSK